MCSNENSPPSKEELLEIQEKIHEYMPKQVSASIAQTTKPDDAQIIKSAEHNFAIPTID